MNVNFPVLLIAALVPLILGFIWYNNKLFGNAWMQGAGLTPDRVKGGNIVKIMGLSYICSFLVAFALQFMVIHQWSFYSILANEPGIQDPNSEIGMYAKDFMTKYAHNFRTFKHGALHGTIAGFTVALPIIAINALFERRSGKYIWINAFFWIICMAIMGGIICQFE